MAMMLRERRKLLPENVSDARAGPSCRADCF
jgi:hypothetical protein